VKTLVKLLIGWLLFYGLAYAQLVTIPIPGSPLSLNIMANPQPLQNIHANPAATAYHLGDDGFANVPLQFDFPFFNKTFNNSTMYSNGAVQFGPPVLGFPANNTFCCNGITIDRNTPGAYNYSILVLQTDLYGASGRNHYSLGTATNMTYGWYGVERLGDSVNKNNFELKITNTGSIDMRWSGALITMNTPTIGVIGDAVLGEFAVIQQGSLNQNFSLSELTQWTTGQTLDFILDPCLTNPLYAETCVGYQAANLIQQCSANALYATTCIGYQAAYLTQQCNANALYSSSCVGYQSAYFTQQCNADSLYDINCSGHAAAYLTQQCSLNTLYSTTCLGYVAAYKTQQCTLNALYAQDCLGYAQAYLNSRCIIDSLYSNKCEGYATAYAIKYLVDNIDSGAVNSSLSATAATKARDPAVVETNKATTTINTDGTVSTAVSVTGDTNVDKAIASRLPSASNNSLAAAVQLVAAPPPAGPPEPKPAANTLATPKQSAETNAPKPVPTARQEMQAKREATAKAKAVEEGKNLAANMGKETDMEQQKQVQNVVIQAMGYTPGFDVYSKTVLQDVIGYKPFTVYKNQKTIDNRNNLKIFSGTDVVHTQLVNSQYKEK